MKQDNKVHYISLDAYCWILVILITLFILTLGIINLYSCTFGSGKSFMFIHQLYWVGFGLIAMIITALFPYERLSRLAIFIYLASTILLMVVLIMGMQVQGSIRWLKIGPLRIQPSELAKFAVILMLSKYYSENPSDDGYSLKELIWPAVIFIIPFIMILKEPDLGTALLVLFIAMGITFFAGIRFSSIITLIVSAVIISPIAWTFLKDYQKERLLSLIYLGSDPMGRDYHIIQSKLAIGSGSLTGLGYLNGTQSHLQFLPAKETDFVFSVWAEEWGFLGSVFLILLYTILLLLLLQIARQAKDRFGAYIVIGFLILIFAQTAINIGMVTGILPVVGMPLPLMSKGGSSLITTLAGIGLVINVRRRRYFF